MDSQKNQSVSEEIKHLSPELDKYIPGKFSYDVPEDYFEKMEDQLVSQFVVAGYFQKSQNCSVHEEYFIQNEQKILKYLESGKKKVNYNWMYAAASIALLFMFVFLDNVNKENVPVHNEELAFIYLEENLETWDLEEMVNDGIINETIVSEWSSEASPWLDSLSISQ